MKTVLRQIRANPRYSKVLEWGTLLSVAGSAQMFVQGLGLLSGILIIRLVSAEEYALYTLAYTMLGTIVSLADGGIVNGVMASGAKVWQSKQGLGSVVATGMELRRKFAMVTLAISMPVLFYLLVKHEAGWLTATLIILALVPVFYAMLTDDLLAVSVKLHQDVVALQKNDILANCGRFVLLIGGLFIFPFAALAILANGLPRIWANIKLRRISAKFADLSAPPDPVVRKDILGMVKRTLPGTIYYCVAGQISVWLISIYSNTTSIAEIGALGRLSALLTVLTTVFATVVTPRFARLPEDPKVLLKGFFQIMAVVTVLVVGIPALVYLFPTQVLYVLGRNYSTLVTEVFQSALGACLFMMVGLIYSLSVSRAWIISPAINITSGIAVQILLISTIDLSTTSNVLLCALLGAFWGVIMYTGYFFYRIFKLREQERAAT